MSFRKKNKSESRLTRQGSTASLTSMTSLGKGDGGRSVYLPESSGNDFINDVDQVHDRPDWYIGPMDTASFKKLKQNVEKETSIPEEVRNKRFNRHMDVLPNPRTRVEVPAVDDDSTTSYFNANYVRGADNNPRKYLCSMAPLPATLKTWWRMIWHNKVSSIVMATGLMEKKVKKCERYWAPRPGQKVKVADMFVRTVQVTELDGYIRTLMEIEHPSGEKRKLAHFWYNTWPDHGVPRNPDGQPNPKPLLYMIRDMYRAEAEISQGGPLLIHCSAGVGRSGTIIALDIACQLLETQGKVDLLKVIEEIRKDRVALVQHAQQYELVYAGIQLYAKLVQTTLNVSDSAIGAPTQYSQKALEAKKKEIEARREAAKKAAEEKARKQKAEEEARRREAEEQAKKAAAASAASQQQTQYQAMNHVDAAAGQDQYGVPNTANDQAYGPVGAVNGVNTDQHVYGAVGSTANDDQYGPVSRAGASKAPAAEHVYGSVDQQQEYADVNREEPQAEYAAMDVPVATTQEAYEEVPSSSNTAPATGELVYGDVMANADKLAQQMEAAMFGGAQMYENQDKIDEQKGTTVSADGEYSKPRNEDEAKAAEEAARREAERQEAEERARRIAEKEAEERRKREQAEMARKSRAEKLQTMARQIEELKREQKELTALVDQSENRLRALAKNQSDTRMAISHSETNTQAKEEELVRMEKRLEEEKRKEAQQKVEEARVNWAQQTQKLRAFLVESKELIDSSNEKLEQKMFRLCLDKAPAHKTAFLHADHPLVALQNKMCDTPGKTNAQELDVLGISSTFTCIN